jgi:hypothetical protein
MTPLIKLMAYYADQGRALDSITHLCGRTRKTLIKHARRANISFPDLRKANRQKQAE